MSIGALGIMLGVLLSGYLADKFGTVKVLVGGLSISLLMIYPTFLIGPGHEVLTGAMLFLLLATNLGVGGLIKTFTNRRTKVQL